MKFITFFAFFLISAVYTIDAVIGAPQKGTNADRLARGLPPLPPIKRDPTPVSEAKRGVPSSTPGQCTTGVSLCCKRTSKASLEGILVGLLGILGIHPDVTVGVTCSPLSIGGGRNSCTQKPVCCEKNWFNGAMATGCKSITL
ncbi:hypothetical protein VKT23_000015 [Stygiomarasmius scandens]|uniref:Hydrophobin n=1 Tax=Marasmiellus scandens TaxID=2682957 RepID=A0ABR1K2W9_9AGAR